MMKAISLPKYVINQNSKNILSQIIGPSYQHDIKNNNKKKNLPIH